MMTNVYVREYAAEEAPMADFPAVVCATALISSACLPVHIRRVEIVLEHGPEDALALTHTADEHTAVEQVPKVWVHDAAEEDGGWYVTYNMILSSLDIPWRFRTPTGAEAPYNEYLMVLRKYDEGDPQLQKFSVVEA